MKRDLVVGFLKDGSLASEKDFWDWALQEAIMTDYRKAGETKEESEIHFWNEVKKYCDINDQNIQQIIQDSKDGTYDENRSEYLLSLKLPYIIINSNTKQLGIVGELSKEQNNSVLSYANQQGYSIIVQAIDEGTENITETSSLNNKIFKATVNEYDKGVMNNFKTTLIRVHKLTATSMSDLAKQIYAIDRSNRYINLRWTEIVEPEIKEAFDKWKRNDMTIEDYYGGGIID